jgi:nucleoporin POM34
MDTYTTYAYLLILSVFLLNVLVAMMPLLRAKDDISDIPLTPAQRKLLGLPPTSKPPTPGSQYVTPPRYVRTPSGSPASRAGSPLSGSPINGSRSNSPFSPGATQYLQKAIGGAGFDGSRRHSYGSPSPLGPAGSKANVQEMPGTPSPAAAKGASVGLNNRWLFEKGRRNSGNARLYA